MSEEQSALERGTDWGEFLASLDDAERERARRAARQALMANIPDDGGRPPVRKLGEFLDEELPTPPILVAPGLVARGGVTAMIAKGGKGKTTLSFNRLLRWACNRPLFGELPDVMAPTQHLRSLIIENEGGGWHTQKVLRRMLASGDFSDEDREWARDLVHVWGDGGWSKMKLDNPENLELVKRGVEATCADIVFLEPFRGLWKGDENSSTEMSNVLDAFHEIANEYNCAVMVTHHERKGTGEGQDLMEQARGSGVFTDLGAVMESWRPVAGNDQREWKLTKARYEDAPAPVRMTFDRDKWGYTFVGENDNARRAIAVVTNYGEVTAAQVAQELEENQPTVTRWLNKASDDGRLEKRMKMNPTTGGRAYHFRLTDAPDEDEEGGGALPVI